MKINSDNSRRLADYIYDDLGPEEIAEMEMDIADDPEFSDSYRMNMMVKNYLKVKVELESMRSDPHLEDAEKLAQLAFGPEGGHPRKKRRSIAYASGLAAAIAILVTVGIIAINTSTEKLFDRYYEPYSASDNTQRGVDNKTYQDIAEGIESYSAGRYEQSIRQFTELESDQGISAEVQFFTGISYMGLENFPEARQFLQQVIDDGPRYHLEAMWYLSLCYLKTGEVDRATALLNQLEAYQFMYSTDAQALEKKLRRIRP